MEALLKTLSPDQIAALLAQSTAGERSTTLETIKPNNPAEPIVVEDAGPSSDAVRSGAVGVGGGPNIDSGYASVVPAVAVSATIAAATSASAGPSTSTAPPSFSPDEGRRKQRQSECDDGVPSFFGATIQKADKRGYLHPLSDVQEQCVKAAQVFMDAALPPDEWKWISSVIGTELFKGIGETPIVPWNEPYNYNGRDVYAKSMIIPIDKSRRNADDDDDDRPRKKRKGTTGEAVLESPRKSRVQAIEDEMRADESSFNQYPVEVMRRTQTSEGQRGGPVLRWGVPTTAFDLISKKNPTLAKKLRDACKLMNGCVSDKPKTVPSGRYAATKSDVPTIVVYHMMASKDDAYEFRTRCGIAGNHWHVLQAIPVGQKYQNLRMYKDTGDTKIAPLTRKLRCCQSNYADVMVHMLQVSKNRQFLGTNSPELHSATMEIIKNAKKLFLWASKTEKDEKKAYFDLIFGQEDIVYDSSGPEMTAARYGLCMPESEGGDRLSESEVRMAALAKNIEFSVADDADMPSFNIMHSETGENYTSSVDMTRRDKHNDDKTAWHIENALQIIKLLRPRTALLDAIFELSVKELEGTASGRFLNCWQRKHVFYWAVKKYFHQLCDVPFCVMLNNFITSNKEYYTQEFYHEFRVVCAALRSEHIQLLYDVAMVITKRRGKKNTMYIHSQPSYGKSTIFRFALEASVQPCIIIGALSGEHMFGELVAEHRLAISDDQSAIITAFNADKVKGVMGGVRTPVNAKYITGAETCPSPVLWLSNHSELHFDSRYIDVKTVDPDEKLRNEKHLKAYTDRIEIREITKPFPRCGALKLWAHMWPCLLLAFNQMALDDVVQPLEKRVFYNYLEDVVCAVRRRIETVYHDECEQREESSDSRIDDFSDTESTYSQPPVF